MRISGAARTWRAVAAFARKATATASGVGIRRNAIGVTSEWRLLELLCVLFGFAYWMKREYWKDVH